MKLLERTWISPVVTLAFAVIGATGVLLFFHIKNGIIMALHEWVGWGFVITGSIHLLLNWRPLLTYVKRPAALLALGVCALMLVVLTVAGAGHEKMHGPPQSNLAPAIVAALDVNRDGTLQASELSNASSVLMNLDRDGDGQVSPGDVPQRGPAHNH